jgi:hypothetical protein
VISRVLDAPDVLTKHPAKLIDFNDMNQLAVALGASVYIWEDGDVMQLMGGGLGYHLTLLGGRSPHRFSAR